MQHPNSSNLSRNEEGWGQNQLSNGRLISNENDENPLGLWSTLSMNDFYCQEVAGDSINPLITPILQQSTSDLFGTKISNHSLLSTNVADSISQTPTTLNTQLAKPEDLAAFSDDITHGLSFAPFDFLSLNGSPYTQLSKDGAVTVSSDKRPVTFDSGDTVYNPDKEIQGFYSNSLSSSIPSSPNPSSIGAVVVEVEPETGRTRKRRHLEATATTAAPKPKPNSVVGTSRSEYTTIDLLPGAPLAVPATATPKPVSFTCPCCNIQFQSQAAGVTHCLEICYSHAAVQVDGILRFKDDACPFIKQDTTPCHRKVEGTNWKHNMACHLSTHVRRERVFACSQCPKTYMNAKTLRNHVREHEGGLFPCDRCNAKFTSAGRRDRHVATHRMNGDARPGRRQ